MDIIFIDELRVSTLIGIYPREKAMPQTVEMSLQIGTVTTSAGASDEISDTIDYAMVVERLRAELASQHFNLLEKLAEYVARLLLEDFGATWAVSYTHLDVYKRQLRHRCRRRSARPRPPLPGSDASGVWRRRSRTRLS